MLTLRDLIDIVVEKESSPSSSTPSPLPPPPLLTPFSPSLPSSSFNLFIGKYNKVALLAGSNHDEQSFQTCVNYRNTNVTNYNSTMRRIFWNDYASKVEERNEERERGGGGRRGRVGGRREEEEVCCSSFFFSLTSFYLFYSRCTQCSSSAPQWTA